MAKFITSLGGSGGGVSSADVMLLDGSQAMTGELQLANGLATAPALTFSAQTNKGFFADTGFVHVSIGGTTVMSWRSSSIDFKQPLTAKDANGASVLNEASSNTNPTLIPDRADLTAGIGGTSGEVSIITGATEAIRWNGSQQTLVPTGTAALPSIADNSNTDLGIYFGTNTVNVAINGAVRFTFGTTNSSIGHLYPGTDSFFNLGSTSLTWQSLYSESIFLSEQASAAADSAGYGQLWIKNDTPNTFWFTDDAGTDFQVSTLTGTETLTGKTIQSPDGVVGTVSYGFASSNGTGLYQPGVNELGLATGGALRMTLAGGQLRSGNDGSAASPNYSWAADVNTGMWRAGTDLLAFSTAGVEALRFDASQGTKFAKTAYFNTEVDNGNSSTADTIDWTAGNKQKSTLTGNVTYTFTAPAGPCSLTFRMIQDATGSRTATWPAAVKWSGGVAPTLTTAANAIDIVSFYWDGTSYYGTSSLNFS